jgi:hypothetical protein
LIKNIIESFFFLIQINFYINRKYNFKNGIINNKLNESLMISFIFNDINKSQKIKFDFFILHNIFSNEINIFNRLLVLISYSIKKIVKKNIIKIL